jgi:anti-anti-sigma regulatory factor
LGISLEQDDAQSLIRLEGMIDISCAAELKKLLLKVLEPGREVRVSLDETTDLDVTAIELLWAAERAARSSDVRFALAGQVPKRISTAVADAGFEKFPISL